MATVGLIIKETNPVALEAAGQLSDFLQERGALVRARAALAARLSGTGLCCESTEAELAASDFVVVLGGDGTLLGAARLLAPYGTPMLPVHLGHFGFITEVPPEALLPAVEKALAGQCTVEERMMLAGRVQRGDGEEAGAGADTPLSLLALNDIVVASGAVRMVRVRTRIGTETLATYAADGVIVASPTGSTGYSLSAGGPLVHPTAPVLVITPVSAHTMSARALLVPDTETVHLTVEGEARDMVVASVDGQIEVPLRPGDTVSVSKSPHRAKLLGVGGPSFYQKIRARWHYGERGLRDEP